MPEAESGQTTGRVLIDAGVFIGALLNCLFSLSPFSLFAFLPSFLP
jgi:hypothetical protein